MILNVEGTLLDVNEKPYDYTKDGSRVSGVSYSALIKDSENKYIKVGLTAEQYREVSSLVGSVVDFDCRIFVNGTYSLKLA